MTGKSFSEALIFAEHVVYRNCFWHSEPFLYTQWGMFCKNKSFWQRFTCTVEFNKLEVSSPCILYSYEIFCQMVFIYSIYICYYSATLDIVLKLFRISWFSYLSLLLKMYKCSFERLLMCVCVCVCVAWYVPMPCPSSHTT